MMRALAPYLAYAFMSLVGWTSKIRVLHDERRAALRKKDQRFIYAFWHNRQAFFTYSHRGDPLSVLVSRSRDGDIVAKVMDLSRIGSCRGSSSRGAVAGLREMMAVLEAGQDLGITPDGPRGPAREVKSGALFLAQKLGVPILPTTNAISRKLVLKRSWDQYQVPLPFGKACIAYGEPIWVDPKDDMEKKAEQLKAALDDITDQAEHALGRWEA
ncbi:MAG: lysophospholipid acyltransferase family protein [Elusimicrobia bacterium]|nr:lysophospholipid acyltransferase family protein [Elusimicrobiota bacterium]